MEDVSPRPLCFQLLCFQVVFLPTGPEAGVRPLTQVFREDHTLPLNNGHSRHQKPQVGKA